jgi:3-dehydrosphinganine reductase
MVKQPLKNKIAVVCGASFGIGKETAKEMARLGASLCIIARNPENLEAAASDMRKIMAGSERFVDLISCDAADFDALKPELTKFVKQRGVPDYLINNVGYAYPQYAHKLTFEDFKKNMDMNYLGQLAPTLVLLPCFMAAKKGHIAFVSSMMGYFGMMGYAAYAPTKFALVGLAEALRHEMKPYNIKFSVIYPPDTETPGYKTENQTKPAECRMMAEHVNIMSAVQVAEVFVDGILKNKFTILPGGAGFMWRMYRHFPRLVRRILDLEYRKTRQQLKLI